MYDPVAAVMMGPDPSSTDPYHTDDYNKFAYVWNNPLKYTDPTGLNVDWFKRYLGNNTYEVKYFPTSNGTVEENGYLYENVGKEVYYKSEQGNVYGDENGSWYLTGFNGPELTTITQDGGKPRDPVKRLDFEDDFVQPESDLPNQSFEEFRKVVQAYDGMFNFVSGYGVATAYLAPEALAAIAATPVVAFNLVRNKLAQSAATKAVIATGQRHHLLSNKIVAALEKHPTLKGVFNREDPKFIYRALDDAAHRGYQTWHRQYDNIVRNWLRDNPIATPQQFTKYLHDLHQQSWLRNIIPNVNLF